MNGTIDLFADKQNDQYSPIGLGSGNAGNPLNHEIMEKIHALIAQLNRQANEQAEPAQLLLTVQLLQQEISAKMQSPKILGTSKVAVVMPASHGIAVPAAYEPYAPKVLVETPVAKPEEEQVVPEKEPVPVVQPNGKLHMNYDPLIEIPTLSQQVKKEEKKNTEPESLNDRLKQGKMELMEMLKESPVKDLRKAIGINDRFVFINDLFRGDEAMYERSIKTINGFNIFPEAEYWISRELKVKLGWGIDDPLVHHFDQLVKRRFS